jgi:hypothetical protein
MKKILLILILVLLIFNSDLFALDSGAVVDESSSKIKLTGGYIFIDTSGSKIAEEFKYLHDSIFLDGEIMLYVLPHRLHFDINYLNTKEYSGDITYSFKDLLLIRGKSSTLSHSLDNVRLIDINTSTPSPGVDVRDADEEYEVKAGISNAFLRLKMPDFPFHLYINGMLHEKNGTQQQRFMGGAAYFNEIVRASRGRDIDWKTENITIGANSHLGPVEIDYSHSEKRFDASGDNVLFDNYNKSGFGPPACPTEPSGVCTDLKGSTDTLKIHTTYTGRLVASATFSRTDRENIDSEAMADYFIGSGDVTWMPADNLTLFFKYRHKDTDLDNPESVTITDITDPSNTYTYDEVRPSISSIKDRFSGTARYRPVSGLTLRAKYSYEDIRRKDADNWEIPDETIRNMASLSADVRIIRNLKLMAKYIHKFNNNPATNIEPDRSNEGILSVSWIPVPWLNALVSYGVKRENRDNLHFIDTEEAENRDVEKDCLMGSVTLLALKDLSLTASYAYFDHVTQQDIEYHDTSGIPHIDSYVPYKNNVHNYAIDIAYVPQNNITLRTGLSRVISKGMFHTSDINLTQPVSIDSFSELKIKETVYTISGEYKYKRGLSSGVQYSYSKFDDVLDSPYDDINDGKAHIILLTLAKEW